MKQRSSDSVLRSIHSNRLLLFTLSAGLFFAGFGQFHWVYYGMTHGANLGFPSVSDVCYIVATLLITVGIYLAYEMNGYDFLDEIENNAFILSVASASTIVVMAAIHGGEFIEVIRQGKEHPLRYAFDLFYAILHVSNIVIVVRLFRKFPADRLSYGWQVFRNYFLATLSLLFLADVLRGFPFTIGNSLSLSSTNIAYALALLFLSLSVLFCPINDPLDAV